MKKKLLITFLKWYLKKHHSAVLPEMIIDEIIDNFLTYDSYLQMRHN